MRLEEAADERVSFEDRVAALQHGGQIVQVHRLEVAANVEYDVPSFAA